MYFMLQKLRSDWIGFSFEVRAPVLDHSIWKRVYMYISKYVCMCVCIYACVHWSDSVYSLAPHLCFCCKSLSMLAGAMYTSFETFAVQLIFYFNFIFELQMHSFFFLFSSSIFACCAFHWSFSFLFFTK